jgi:hypothetical protein
MPSMTIPGLQPQRLPQPAPQAPSSPAQGMFGGVGGQFPFLRMPMSPRNPYGGGMPGLRQSLAPSLGFPRPPTSPMPGLSQPPNPPPMPGIRQPTPPPTGALPGTSPGLPPMGQITFGSNPYR